MSDEKPVRKPTESEKTFLDRAMAWGRAQRDKFVNNERTAKDRDKNQVTHLPTGSRTRREIMEELTQKK